MAAPGFYDTSSLLPPLATAAARAAVGDIEGGRQALAPIAGKVWLNSIATARPIAPLGGLSLLPNGRRSFNARRSAQAMTRDRFRCRYCGQKIVPRRLLVAMSTLYPAELPYYTHYKRGTVHSVYWTVAAEADHAEPGSRGGAWEDVDNLVTACVYCNTRKAHHRVEEIGWSLEPITDSDGWDGLTSHYGSLCEVAGCSDLAYHRGLVRAFNLDT